MIDRYAHIARDAKLSIQISAEEMAALFYAYDYGLDALDGESREKINQVLAKLKDEAWP